MPGSKAETVHGRRGGGWLPASMPVRQNDRTYGGPNQCATCQQQIRTVAIAHDPGRPSSGRWYVCRRCRDGWTTHKPHGGLVYEPIEGVT